MKSWQGHIYEVVRELQCLSRPTSATCHTVIRLHSYVSTKKLQGQVFCNSHMTIDQFWNARLRVDAASFPTIIADTTGGEGGRYDWRISHGRTQVVSCAKIALQAQWQSATQHLQTSCCCKHSCVWLLLKYVAQFDGDRVWSKLVATHQHQPSRRAWCCLCKGIPWEVVAQRQGPRSQACSGRCAGLGMQKSKDACGIALPAGSWAPAMSIKVWAGSC